MSCYLRPRLAGASVFFTLALAQRGTALLVEEIARLRWAVGVTLRDRPVRIDAMVVLPDHLHALWTLPDDDSDYGTRWRLIKTRFSSGLPKGPLRLRHARRHERGIWQRRFWEHHIRSAADFEAHRAFCWTAPVRQGLTERPEDWPFSSIHRDQARPPPAGDRRCVQARTLPVRNPSSAPR